MPTPSRPSLPLLAAAAVALLGACGDTGDGASRKVGLGGRCASTTSCADPYVCLAGTCQFGSGEGAPCPDGDECAAPLVCEAGTCAPNLGAECARQADCAASLVCYLGTCETSEPAGASCATPGAMPAIVSGLPITTPDPGTTCRLDPSPPVPGPGPTTVVAFGERQVGSQLTFSLPEGSTGFTILSQEKPGTAVDDVEFVYSATQRFLVPNTVVPNGLRDPANRLVYDDVNFPAVPEAALAYYGGFTQTTGAFGLPNTARLLDELYVKGALPAGPWRFQVNDWAYECDSVSDYAGLCGATGSDTGVYDTSVLVRQGPLASTGTMDLAIYLVTGTLTAAGAPGDPSFRRFVSSIATVLGRAGLCLGTVTVYDVPAWAHDRYRTVLVGDDPDTADLDEGGVCGPLAQMFTLSQGANALQLFLVDELLVPGEGDGDFQIAGIDGSIPGPSAANGTINSGAAVPLGTMLTAGSCTTAGLNLRSCGADFLAYVAAHEIGHWLGLYHVTERSGGMFDPLTDTATCECTQCSGATATSCESGAAELTVAMCDGVPSSSGVADRPGCGGGDNLMFWLVDQQLSQGTLSRQQGQVVRLNPAVR